MRHALAVAAFTLCSLGVAAAEPDPTFNGTIIGADCYVRTLTVCVEGYCTQAVGPCVGDHCGTIQFTINGHKYRVLGSEPKPLQITAMSPAELGKPLWLKFPIEVGHDRGNGMLTLDPNGFGGGYKASASIYVDLSAEQPGKQAFGIENLECNHYSGTGE